MSATTQTQAVDAPTQNNDEARELARTLVANMTAADIRSWMSEEGLTRSRAARKMESALQAYEQDPELVREKADELVAGFEVSCPNCDLDEAFAAADEAEERARDHKSANHTHFPRAVDVAADERIYG